MEELINAICGKNNQLCISITSEVIAVFDDDYSPPLYYITDHKYHEVKVERKDYKNLEEALNAIHSIMKKHFNHYYQN